MARRLAPSWWRLGRRTSCWSRRRAWPTRGSNSHGSLLRLPLLLQLPVSLWVSIPVWVCSPVRLWLWLRPLLRGVALRGGRVRDQAERPPVETYLIRERRLLLAASEVALACSNRFPLVFSFLSAFAFGVRPTPRWREPDSNPRSPATRGNVSRLPVGLWVTNRYR